MNLHLPPLTEEESSIIHHALVRVRESNSIQNRSRWSYPASIAWSIIDLYFDKKGTFDTSISITEPFIEFIQDALEAFALSKGDMDSSIANNIMHVKWKLRAFLLATKDARKYTSAEEQEDITNI